jgi:hypothetical protein
MKLPKCPHCEKLLVGMLPHVIPIGVPDLVEEATYFCPETGKKQKPDWVEVLEV